MNRIQVITSTKNPRVKEAVRLFDRRHRDETGLMLVEGVKEVTLAMRSGVAMITLFYCPELVGSSGGETIVAEMSSTVEMIEVGREVFGKLAYREGTGGLVAVAEQPARVLSDLAGQGAPLFVVVDGVEKPGNLGAIMRSADAAGVDGVIVCGHSTDICNPNAVRASIGTIFTVPVVQVSSATDVIGWLKDNGIRLVAASPHAETDHFDADLTGPCAIAVGSEHEGLSDEWLESADILVRIPMKGEADSLNLAASATVLLYEALRQRRERP